MDEEVKYIELSGRVSVGWVSMLLVVHAEAWSKICMLTRIGLKGVA